MTEQTVRELLAKAETATLDVEAIVTEAMLVLEKHLATNQVVRGTEITRICCLITYSVLSNVLPSSDEDEVRSSLNILMHYSNQHSVMVKAVADEVINDYWKAHRSEQ